MRRSDLLRKVQAADFAMYDTALYLDTHPDDKKALECYYKLRKDATEARNAYESIFGPLSMSAVNDQTNWTWINEPWPWERGE